MYPARLLRRRRGPLLEEDDLTTPPLARPVALPAPIRPVAPVVAEPIAESVALPPPVNNAAVPSPTWTTTDRRSRPRILTGVPESERGNAERELFEKLQSYEPRKRSILRQIGMGALRGFAAGGPGGAIGGAIFGGGTALLDPTAEDRAWRERQMAESMQRQQVYRGRERQGLQDDLLRAQVDETKAQAEQRRNPRPRLVEQVLPDGTVILAPEAPGVITGRPKEPLPKYTVAVPGVGEIQASPGEALGYYGQVERRGEERGIREGERLSNFERARISLTEAEKAERDSLEARRQISERITALRKQRQDLKPDPAQVGYDGRINDPGYWAQADALDAQIEEAQREATRRQNLADEAAREKQKWQGELGRYGARPTTTTTPPPPPGVTEASVRAEARRRGQDEDAAVRRAREFGWIR